MSKRRQESAKKGSPAWMATFSDLMNLLLCFFVMLFSLSTINDEDFEILKQSFKNDYVSFFDGGQSFFDNSTSNSDMSIVESEGSANGQNTDDFEKVEDLDEQVAKVEKFDESLEVVEEQKKMYSDKMFEEVSDMLEEQNLGSDMVKIEKDEQNNYVMLTVAGSLLFDSGAVEIKEECKPVLSRIGDILLMFAGYQIEIVGHTDSVPVGPNHPYKDNNELSTDRALSTFYYLVNEKGLDPATMKYSGRGEYDPIAENDTLKGRQQNRRIEIKIFNDLSRY